MALTQDIRDKIEQHIGNDAVVLFMKGTREQPQCGFSATVVDILDSLVPTYHTVNVLADNSIREGIKEFSEWPTIPQLYVGGEFVGGCDIVREMFGSGELQQKLGVDPGQLEPPQITISDAAAEALRAAEPEEPSDVLHLSVSPSFEHHLGFGPRDANSMAAQSNGVTLYIDLPSVRRANGISLDFVEGPNGSGFKIENPNAPERVQSMPVTELKRLLDAGSFVALFDVRTPEEWDMGHIQGATFFDRDAEQRIASMAKDTPIVFYCHTGGRSYRAAEHFVQAGYTNVYNLEGGIDAWAAQIDPSLPRY